jgi:hypothetical protein
MGPYPEPARRPPIPDSVSHAEFHLREDGTGVGAAVVRSSLEHGERTWDVIVRDADEWPDSPLHVGRDAPPDTALRFAAYVAELDREHRASDAYADAVTRAAGCGPTPALPSPSELDELFRPA